MKSSRAFKFAVVLLLAFLAWILLAPSAAKFLIVEKPLAKADAIFILSGSSVYVERTQTAAELYRENIAPRVILTDDGERGGWSRLEERNPPFAEIARRKLIEQGVPAASIEILSPTVSGTIDEARLLAETAKRENLHSVLLVTSAYHTRRTFSTFEKIAAENNLQIEIGIAHAPTGIQTPPPEIWWLSPRGWQWVAGEYVKMLFYWVYY